VTFRTDFSGDRGDPSGLADPRPSGGQYDKAGSARVGDDGVHSGQQVADVWAGSGELDPFPARGEQLADLAPLRTGREFRASMCYTVTEVRNLTA
jgi:hypothetical protein